MILKGCNIETIRRCGCMMFDEYSEEMISLQVDCIMQQLKALKLLFENGLQDEIEVDSYLNGIITILIELQKEELSSDRLEKLRSIEELLVNWQNEIIDGSFADLNNPKGYAIDLINRMRNSVISVKELLV